MKHAIKNVAALLRSVEEDDFILAANEATPGSSVDFYAEAHGYLFCGEDEWVSWDGKHIPYRAQYRDPFELLNDIDNTAAYDLDEFVMAPCFRLPNHTDAQTLGNRMRTYIKTDREGIA